MFKKVLSLYQVFGLCLLAFFVLLFVSPPLFAAEPLSEVPTLHSPSGQAFGQPVGKTSALSASALWDQPLGVGANAYVNQEFIDYPEYTSFLADDFVNNAPWNITALYVPGGLWNGGTTLMNATSLNWSIYGDNGSGLPDGYPSGAGNTPIWSISVAPTDTQVTITNGTGGYPSNTRIDLTTPINLPAGTWWLFFYPTMGFSSGGQFGRQMSDTTNGAAAQFINPAGGFGLGTAWQPASVLGATEHDLAFTIEGTEDPVGPVGTIGTQFTFAGSDFGQAQGKFLIGTTTAAVVKGSWTSTDITCIVKKSLPAGTYDITITPKGGTATTFPAAFRMSNPVIDSLSSTEGFEGEEITISGSYFGTKKGKVYLEYEKDGVPKKKSCQVRLWTMDPMTGDSQIIFVVPKGLDPTTYPLTIINKVGSTQTGFEVK